MIDKTIITGIITRMLVILLGGYLVKVGWTDDRINAWINATADLMAGAAMIGFSFLWALWSRKKQTDKVIEQVQSGELPKPKKDDSPTLPGLQLLLPLLLSAVLFGGSGCQLMQANQQRSFLEDAEKAQASSLLVVETIWTVDNDNRDLMRQSFPAIHQLVEQSRREFPAVYIKAEAAIAAYRAIKTEQNQGDVTDTLQTVSDWSGKLKAALIQLYGNGVQAPKGKANVSVNFAPADGDGKGANVRQAAYGSLADQWRADARAGRRLAYTRDGLVQV